MRSLLIIAAPLLLASVSSQAFEIGVVGGLNLATQELSQRTYGADAGPRARMSYGVLLNAALKRLAERQTARQVNFG